MFRELLDFLIIVVGLFFCFIVFVAFPLAALEFSQYLYPILTGVMISIIAVFFLFLLASIFSETIKHRLGTIFTLLANVLQVTVFIYSFLIIMEYLGWVAILCFFIRACAAPIAIIGLLIKKQWILGSVILIGYLFINKIRGYVPEEVNPCT